ncbi:hypothetical protein [Paenibacillus paeoniae]|uniref:Uncharacterized protein n=1 Tax=Paenibacillus paeoniae TaxID=2292705 RepID=A0A371P6H0_9BACL|nr:hypothetical protein [Paenibacillus paeoniae]REK71492.1 hypothetical protein DX130_21060 [Paenibacillus paeoniae]
MKKHEFMKFMAEKYDIWCEIHNREIIIDTGGVFQIICRSLMWNHEIMSVKFQQAALRRIKARANNLTKLEIKQIISQDAPFYVEPFQDLLDKNYIAHEGDKAWETIKADFLEYSDFWSSDSFSSKAPGYLNNEFIKKYGIEVDGIEGNKTIFFKKTELIPSFFLTCCQKYTKVVNKDITIKSRSITGDYKGSPKNTLNDMADVAGIYLKVIRNSEDYWENLHIFERETSLISLFGLRDTLTDLKSLDKDGSKSIKKFTNILAYMGAIDDLDVRITASKMILDNIKPYSKYKKTWVEATYFNLTSFYQIVTLWEAYMRLLEEVIETEIYEYGYNKFNLKDAEPKDSETNASKVFKELERKVIISNTLDELENDVVSTRLPINSSIIEDNSSWTTIAVLFQKRNKEFPKKEPFSSAFSYDSWLKYEREY